MTNNLRDNNLRNEIARREKICAAATPGPWWRTKQAVASAGRCIATFPSGGGSYIGKRDPEQAKKDADLAAHARTGYPETLAALADAVAALEKMLAALQYADKNNCNDFLGTGSDGDAADREAREWENAIESGMLAGRAALAQIAGRLGVGREDNQ